jgi:hypothetical protein
MLFDPAVDTIKKGPWMVFIMVAFFGLFGPSGVAFYWYGYVAVIFLFFVLAIFLVAVCERYLVFVTSIFFSVIGVMCFFMSSLCFLFVSSAFDLGAVESVMLGLLPLILVLVAIGWVLLVGDSICDFEKIGNRVALPTKQRKQYSAGLVAGLITLLGGGFLNLVGPINGGLVGVVVGTSGCVALIIYFGKTIRSLCILRAQESQMPVPYTFMRIDEIREARSRWWMGRLLQRLISSRQSHD